MKKKALVYEDKIFASPGHLMNHFRKHKIHSHLDVKYLTQCMFKDVTNVKGVHITYRIYDLDNEHARTVYENIRSLRRSGEGYKVGMATPLEYFETIVVPLLDATINPVRKAIGKALKQGIGTPKDYRDMIKKYREENE